MGGRGRRGGFQKYLLISKLFSASWENATDTVPGHSLSYLDPAGHNSSPIKEIWVVIVMIFIHLCAPKPDFCVVSVVISVQTIQDAPQKHVV